MKYCAPRRSVRYALTIPDVLGGLHAATNLGWMAFPAFDVEATERCAALTVGELLALLAWLQ